MLVEPQVGGLLMRDRMLRYGMTALLLFSGAAYAADTLRVDSQVLTTGDSAARVIELLGKPAHKSKSKSASRSTKGSSSRSTSRTSRRGSGNRSRSRARVADDRGTRGEQWQYRRDGRSITVTIVDGRVSGIDTRSR
jgi:hypothetical protein